MMLLYSTVNQSCSNYGTNEGNTNDRIKDSNSSDDNNGVNIILGTLLTITVFGLMISIVIIVFFVVRRKQSRCVVTSIIVYVAIVGLLFLLQR